MSEKQKGLVQVQMNHIKPHVPWPDLAENGVQVGTVIIKQSTGATDDSLEFLESGARIPPGWMDLSALFRQFGGPLPDARPLNPGLRDGRWEFPLL